MGSTPKVSKPPRTEPISRVWARRAISIPALFLFTAAFAVAAPAIFLIVVIADIIRRNDFRGVRFVATMLSIALLHVLGVILLFDAYLRGGAPWVSDKTAEIRMAARAEAWWANAMLQMAVKNYRMRVDIDGQEDLKNGRVVVFMRHTSILDTMLPLALIARPFAKHVRYVMKDMIRWNPAADIVGRQVPTAFVGRKAGSHKADLAEVNALGDNLDNDGIIVIYPEGTRFTKDKQEKRLAQIAKSNPRLLPKASALQHTLPLHLGGALTLLDRAKGADIAFFAHVGLDGVVTLRDFWSGALLDRHIRVKIFRVPATELPEAEDARVDWLYDRWKRVDEWIGTQKI